MESSRTVSFTENPLYVHLKGDPEELMSILYAVSHGEALILSEGTLGWVTLDRFTVIGDTLSLQAVPLEKLEGESAQ